MLSIFRENVKICFTQFYLWLASNGPGDGTKPSDFTETNIFQDI